MGSRWWEERNGDGYGSALLCSVVKLSKVEQQLYGRAGLLYVNVDVLAVVSSVARLAAGAYETFLGCAEVVCPAAVYSELDLIVEVLLNIVLKVDLINAGSEPWS